MHEIESLFYTNDVPWHGLGKKLQAPPTITEAITAAGLDWTVSTHPLFFVDPDASVVSSTPLLKSTPRSAVIRDTDHSYLGCVGRDWTPLQNIDAFQFFQPYLESGQVELDTAGSLRHGKRVWILARIKGDPIEVAKDDPILSYFLLANGHDGTMAVTVGFMPIRVVCANTLAAALGSENAKSLRVIHSQKVEENLELIQETVDMARRQFVASAELYAELAKRQINKEDFHRFVQQTFIHPKKLAALREDLKNAGVGGTIPAKRLIDKITPLFESGRGNDLPSVRGTWWAAYNSISEYLAHERGSSADVRVDSLWFGASNKANQRALKVATELAFA